MQAVSLLNAVATFPNAGINRVITAEQLVGRRTPRGAQCLLAPVDSKGNPGDESVSGGEVTKTQSYRERIVTNTEKLVEE
jgi:hypothetical protein